MKTNYKANQSVEQTAYILVSLCKHLSATAHLHVGRQEYIRDQN